MGCAEFTNFITVVIFRREQGTLPKAQRLGFKGFSFPPPWS